MSQSRLFLEVDQPSEAALTWVNERLMKAGLAVVRTFDLQAARTTQTGCTCPHHGSQACDCQVIVLLIYGDNQPASLMIHGYDGKTWFYLVDSPQQRPDPRLEAEIRKTLFADKERDSSLPVG